MNTNDSVNPNTEISGRYENNVLEPGLTEFRTLVLTAIGTYQYTASSHVSGVPPIWMDTPEVPGIPPWRVPPFPSAVENSGSWSPIADTDPVQISLRENSGPGASDVFMTLTCHGNTLTNANDPVRGVWERTGPGVPVITPPIVMDDAGTAG